MNKKTLIWIVVGWALLMLINYYYVPYFILVFEWLACCLIFLILLIGQTIKTIKERNTVSSFRLQKIGVFLVLFLLTFFRVTDKIIEKVDWAIFYNRRDEIVEKIKNKQLNPNVSWNNWVCRLPFRFPVISNGGNEIGIYKNQEKGTITVTFWIFRNFFEAPSTQFIYTNDSLDIKIIEEKIKKDPSDNWRIKENWFRTLGR